MDHASWADTERKSDINTLNPDSVDNQQDAEHVGGHRRRMGDSSCSFEYRSEPSEKPWECGEPLRYPLPKSSENPLGAIYDRMKKYDKIMCDAWKDEIEKLLIFAGLFSATLTAFVVESYKWLQEDNTATTVQLLTQISLQLNSNSNPPIAKQAVFSPDPRSIRINIFWFLSLVLCLSTVVFGILCTQWLREYIRDHPLPPDHAIPERQMHCEGLIAWKVPETIAVLPVILQLSVILFFIGILDLLWSLDFIVATVISAVMGLFLIVLIFTTIAPVFQAIYELESPSLYQCPYKSPQSWIFFQFVVNIIRIVTRTVITAIENFHGKLYRVSPLSPLSTWERTMQAMRVYSWTEYGRVVRDHRGQHARDKGKPDVTDTEALGKAFVWILRTLSPIQNQDIVQDVFHSLDSALPREISHRVMNIWGDSFNLPRIIWEDYNNRALEYDALLLNFLTLYSTRTKCYNLLDELRVRCINSTKTDLSRNSYFWYLSSMRTVDLSRARGKPKPPGISAEAIALEVVLQEFVAMTICSNIKLPFVTSFISSLAHTAMHVRVTRQNILLHQRIRGLSVMMMDYIANEALCAIETGDANAVLHLQVEFRRLLWPEHLSCLLRIDAWERKIDELMGTVPTPVVPKITSFVSRTLVQAAEQKEMIVISGMRGRLRQLGFHQESIE